MGEGVTYADNCHDDHDSPGAQSSILSSVLRYSGRDKNQRGVVKDLCKAKNKRQLYSRSVEMMKVLKAQEFLQPIYPLLTANATLCEYNLDSSCRKAGV